MLLKFLLPIICIFLTYTETKVQKVPAESLTHITNDSALDPIVLKRNNQLIFVSYPKYNSRIDITIKTNSSNDPTCVIGVENPNDRIFKPPRAEVLGNDKIVVAMIEIRYRNVEKHPEIYSNFYVVDFGKKCTHKHFSLLVDYKVLTTYDPLVIVPYIDSFDVFMSSVTYCNPHGGMCMIRFSEKGERLGTRNFNFSTVSTTIDLEKIYPNRKFYPNEGFVFVSKTNSTLLKLDKDLKVTEKLKLKGFVTAHSVLNGKVGVCSKIYEPEPSGSTECLKLNSQLQVQQRYRLENPEDFGVRSLQNLADGSSLLLTVSRKKGKTTVEVRRLRTDGTVSGGESFSYGCEGDVLNPPGRFIELDGSYCFVFQCRFEQITHCIDSKRSLNKRSVVQ